MRLPKVGHQIVTLGVSHFLPFGGKVAQEISPSHSISHSLSQTCTHTSPSPLSTQ